jgi:hypothetical protein
MSETTVIEINGVKLEVDLRHAKRVDQFRIGDRVKVLKKEYSDTFASYPGVIVGFDDFKNLPTIVVCYLKTGYNAEVRFGYMNREAKDIEICHTSQADDLSKSFIVETLDREILKKRAELEELEAKKAFFLANYEAYLKGLETCEES